MPTWRSHLGNGVRLAVMHYELIQQMKKMLGQLDRWLEAANSHATAKSFDPQVFLSLRLAPDQFPFVRQVQTACDTLKLAAARLTAREAPVHPDTELTIEDLRARIRNVLTYIDTLSPKDFEGAAARTISLPRWEGKVMTGSDYFVQHAQPNFYFHATHAYAILRHNGVSLGKRDYLGSMTLRNP
jgi:hypothetical protein